MSLILPPQHGPQDWPLYGYAALAVGSLLTGGYTSYLGAILQGWWL